MGSFPFGTTGIGVKAATPPGGTAMTSGTPTFVSWTVPNDGQLHAAVIVGSQTVTVNQTGGGTTANWTPPSGNAQTTSLNGQNHTTGDYMFGQEGGLHVMCAPGSVVSVTQTAGQSAGVAQIWAQIWGD